MEKERHDEHSARNRKIQYDKAWFGKVIELLKNRKINFGTVTDVGAGKGEFLELARKKNFFEEYQAVDYARTNIHHLERRGFRTFEVDLENCSGNEISGLAKSDLVTSLEVVEHIFNVDGFFNFLNKITKKDGYLVISTPNMGSFAYKIFYFLRGYPVSEGHHIRFFSKRRLIQYAYCAGFDYIVSNNYRSYATDIIRRGFGLKNEFLAKFISRAIFLIAILLDLITFHKFNFSDNGLVILFKKVSNQTIGFNSNNVEEKFASLGHEDKEFWARRMNYFMKSGNLSEHVYFPEKIKKIINESNAKN